MTEAFTAIIEAAKKLGLQINAEKTKYMHVAGKNKKENRNRNINGYNIEEVEEFIYLGTLVTRTNDMSAEIKRKTYLANQTYHGLLRHLRSNVITRNTKCKIYKTLIRPVLMYGSETWTLKQSDEKLLGSFERKVLRCIYRGVCEGGECDVTTSNCTRHTKK